MSSSSSSSSSSSLASDQPSESNTIPSNITTISPPSSDSELTFAPTTKPKPIIGKNTFVWTLSGLAFTTGLTIALIPALRRNRHRHRHKEILVNSGPSKPIRQNHAGGAGVGGGGADAGAGLKEGKSGKRGVLDGLLGSSGTAGTLSSASLSSSISTPSSSSQRTVQPTLPQTLNFPASSSSTSTSTYKKPPSNDPPTLRLTTGSAGSLVSSSILSSLPALGTAGTSSSSEKTSEETIRGSSSTRSREMVGSSSSADSSSPDINVPADPQIKYFSIHPSDPFSDEEDEFGFPRHDPVEGDDGTTGQPGQARDDAEPISPLFALKAFSIATGLVVGSALVGVGLIGWGFGVRNMEEFTAEMRRLTAKKLPSMSENIFKPLPEEEADHDEPVVSSMTGEATSTIPRKIGFDPFPPPAQPRPRRQTPEDEEEETIVSGWWRQVVEGAEEERRAQLVTANDGVGASNNAGVGEEGRR